MRRCITRCTETKTPLTPIPLPAGALGATSYDNLGSRVCYGPTWRNLDRAYWKSHR